VLPKLEVDDKIVINSCKKKIVKITFYE